jgi:hypothetical protein
MMVILIHINNHEDFEKPHYVCYVNFQTFDQQLFSPYQGYFKLVHALVLNLKTLNNQAMGGNLLQVHFDLIQKNTFNYVLT